MTRKPGDKGPMGEDAHEDKASGTSPTRSEREGSDKDLEEDLEESFPASDAPKDTRSGNKK